MSKGQVCLHYAIARTISISEYRGKTCFDYVERKNSTTTIEKV